MKEYLSVQDYAKKIGKTRQQVYNYIADNKVVTRLVNKPKLEVLWSDFKKSKNNDDLLKDDYQDAISPIGRKLKK